MIKVYNAGDKTFGIKVGSTLTREDYKEIVPEIEQKIKQFGSIKLLMQIDGFKSIEPAALWEELKFDIKHHNDFEQIAIVGDEGWAKWSAKFGAGQRLRSRERQQRSQPDAAAASAAQLRTAIGEESIEPPTRS